MTLYIVIVFLGFVGWPLPNNLALKVATSNVTSKKSGGSDASNGDNAFLVSEPITLTMIGSDLVGLAVIGRKWFKK